MAYSSIIRNMLLFMGIVVALVASFYKLSEAPAIWYDEGFYMQIGMNFAERGEQVLQTAPGVYAPTSYITVGFPLIIPLALSYKMFGVGVVEGRTVMALFLLGFIACTYLLARNLYGKDLAPWTLFLLATFPMLYGNGKAVLGEVPGLFFFVATLLSLWHLEKTGFKDWKWYVLTGLTAGLCVATKPFFLLLLGALCITLIIRWRKITLDWRGVAAGVVALCIPLGIWVTLQFGGDASIEGVFTGYTNPYAIENLPTHILQNALRLVTESTPLYTVGLIFIWGMSFIVRRKNSAISSVEVVAFVFCIFTLLSYLRLEGWYRYLFPATVIALAFLPIATERFTSFITNRIQILSSVRWMPYVALLLLSLAQLYQTARSSYVAQYYGSMRTETLSQYLPTLRDQSVFLYNTPELGILLTTSKYYQYLSPLPNVIIGKETLPLLEESIPDIVLINLETYEEEQGLFNKYNKVETVDRYAVLKRR